MTSASLMNVARTARADISTFSTKNYLIFNQFLKKNYCVASETLEHESYEPFVVSF